MKQLFPEEFSAQPLCILFLRQGQRGDIRNHRPYGNAFSARCAGLHKGCFIFAGTSQEFKVQSRADTTSALPADLPLHYKHQS